MLKLLNIYIFFILFLIYSTALSEIEVKSSSLEKRILQEQPIKLLGGYTNQPVNPNDPDVKSAIQTAISALSSGNGIFANGTWKNTKILSVATQVVAGMNYKITAEFTNTKTGEVKTIQFIVFEPLFNAPNQFSGYTVLN